MLCDIFIVDLLYSQFNGCAMTIVPDNIIRFQSDKSDKIWGCLIEKSPNQYYTFWGKVNSVIAFKAWEPNWENRHEIKSLLYRKLAKGYRSVGFQEQIGRAHV